ncbi:MAG: hypothetical protein J0G28_09345 [Afipia sp.]|nr:hypothetical protein [Afipia sp.]
MEEILKTQKIEGTKGEVKPLNERDPAQKKPDVPKENEASESAPKPLPE